MDTVPRSEATLYTLAFPHSTLTTAETPRTSPIVDIELGSVMRIINGSIPGASTVRA